MKWARSGGRKRGAIRLDGVAGALVVEVANEQLEVDARKHDRGVARFVLLAGELVHGDLAPLPDPD